MNFDEKLLDVYNSKYGKFKISDIHSTFEKYKNKNNWEEPFFVYLKKNECFELFDIVCATIEYFHKTTPQIDFTNYPKRICIFTHGYMC